MWWKLGVAPSVGGRSRAGQSAGQNGALSPLPFSQSIIVLSYLLAFLELGVY